MAVDPNTKVKDPTYWGTPEAPTSPEELYKNIAGQPFGSPNPLEGMNADQIQNWMRGRESMRELQEDPNYVPPAPMPIVPPVNRNEPPAIEGKKQQVDIAQNELNTLQANGQGNTKAIQQAQQDLVKAKAELIASSSPKRLNEKERNDGVIIEMPGVKFRGTREGYIYAETSDGTAFPVSGETFTRIHSAYDRDQRIQNARTASQIALAQQRYALSQSALREEMYLNVNQDFLQKKSNAWNELLPPEDAAELRRTIEVLTPYLRHLPPDQSAGFIEKVEELLRVNPGAAPGEAASFLSGAIPESARELGDSLRQQTYRNMDHLHGTTKATIGNIKGSIDAATKARDAIEKEMHAFLYPYGGGGEPSPESYTSPGYTAMLDERDKLDSEIVALESDLVDHERDSRIIGNRKQSFYDPKIFNTNNMYEVFSSRYASETTALTGTGGVLSKFIDTAIAQSQKLYNLEPDQVYSKMTTDPDSAIRLLDRAKSEARNMGWTGVSDDAMWIEAIINNMSPQLTGSKEAYDLLAIQILNARTEERYGTDSQQQPAGQPQAGQQPADQTAGQPAGQPPAGQQPVPPAEVPRVIAEEIRADTGLMEYFQSLPDDRIYKWMSREPSQMAVEGEAFVGDKFVEVEAIMEQLSSDKRFLGWVQAKGIDYSMVQSMVEYQVWGHTID